MMDLNEIPSDHMVLQVAKGNCKLGGASQNLGNKGCGVVERKYGGLEEKRLAFHLEIRSKCVDLEGVKERIKALECEKAVIEEEIGGLRKKATLGGERVVDSLGAEELSLCNWKMDDDEESKVDQLMIENKVLECEKNSALKEVEIWKQKCRELESRVLELEGKLGCQGIDCVPIKTKEALDNVDYDVRASEDLDSTCSPGATSGETHIKGMLATPCNGSPQKHSLIEDTQTTRIQPGINVKRQLAFRNESCCDKKVAPSTPAGARSSSGFLVNIVDSSDDEFDIPEKCGFNKESKRTPCAMPDLGFDGTDVIMDQDDTSGCKRMLPFIETRKRKGNPKVFTSDNELEVKEALPKRRNLKIVDSDYESEDDDIRPMNQDFNGGDPDKDSDDDNIPISQLKINRARVSNQLADLCMRNHSGSQADNAVGLFHRRRRLVKSVQVKKKGGAQESENSPGDLAIENVEVDNLEEDGSDCDTGSLSNFIVDDDVEDVEDGMSEEEGTDDSSKLEGLSDDNLDFEDIISRLQSRKNPNSKWVLEGDMLADFGKDPELCMRAVCALYRQQTTTEKLCKESLVQNGRGFSKFDAARGTKLGQFLTDGDPNGNLLKSTKELQEHDPDGIEVCCTLAKHYSKQLFEIYMNEEDPFFP